MIVMNKLINSMEYLDINGEIVPAKGNDINDPSIIGVMSYITDCVVCKPIYTSITEKDSLECNVIWYDCDRSRGEENTRRIMSRLGSKSPALLQLRSLNNNIYTNSSIYIPSIRDILYNNSVISSIASSLKLDMNNTIISSTHSSDTYTMQAASLVFEDDIYKINYGATIGKCNKGLLFPFIKLK